MKIIPICTESLGSNTYLIVSGAHALVVDPSVSVSAILDVVHAEDANLEGILLTHGHFDHMLSLDPLREARGIPAYIHEDDAELLTDGKKNAFYTFFGTERTWKPADVLLKNGQTIALGDEKIRVIHTPGHTQGSVCYLCGDVLVSGDTIFSEGYGRYDLWGGDEAILQRSLASLRSLDGTLTIYPGHGAPEKLQNALRIISYFIDQ